MHLFIANCRTVLFFVVISRESYVLINERGSYSGNLEQGRTKRWEFQVILSNRLGKLISWGKIGMYMSGRSGFRFSLSPSIIFSCVLDLPAIGPFSVTAPNHLRAF